MNLLTRTVLEDLIKMDIHVSIATFETHPQFGRVLDNIFHEVKPADIILKVLGLNHENYKNFIAEVLLDVYNDKLTITEAIDKLEQERELVR